VFGICEHSGVTTAQCLKRVIERKLKGKSQAEVAEFLAVPPGTLSEWLSDKYEPSLQSLRNVADKLDVTVASLIGDARAAKGKAS
jgi:transcriptional regulator with XRE-family HTH domain